jgi:hypothetical protein
MKIDGSVSDDVCLCCKRVVSAAASCLSEAQPAGPPCAMLGCNACLHTTTASAWPVLAASLVSQPKALALAGCVIPAGHL